MDIRFRQKGIGWCTVYMWANLLNNNEILSFCQDDRFKGCGVDEEDEILLKYSPSIKLQPIFAIDVNYEIPLPASYVWTLMQRKDEKEVFEHQCIIYTLSVRIIEQYHHSVGIIKYNDAFWYVDPMRSRWIEVKSYEQFRGLFKDIWHVQRPIMRNEPAFALFDAETINYPFLEKELA